MKTVAALALLGAVALVGLATSCAKGPSGIDECDKYFKAADDCDVKAIREEGRKNKTEWRDLSQRHARDKCVEGLAKTDKQCGKEGGTS